MDASQSIEAQRKEWLPDRAHLCRITEFGSLRQVWENIGGGVPTRLARKQDHALTLISRRAVVAPHHVQVHPSHLWDRVP